MTKFQHDTLMSANKNDSHQLVKLLYDVNTIQDRTDKQAGRIVLAYAALCIATNNSKKISCRKQIARQHSCFKNFGPIRRSYGRGVSSL